MAVTRVRLLNSTGGEGDNAVDYQLRYLVSTNNRATGPLTVRNAVPWRKGDVYAIGDEFDFRARVKSIRETPTSSSHFTEWFVDVTFAKNDERDSSNPLNDPIQVEMSWTGKSKRTWIDGEGKFVANTAGEPFGDGLEVQDSLPTITYTVNQPFFSEALAMVARNAINATPWKKYPPLTVRVQSIQSRRLVHSNIGVYFEVNYSFTLDKDETSEKVLSMGYYELVQDGPKKKSKRIDVGGGPVAVPWPLDADGKACTRETVNGQLSWSPPPAELTFLKGQPLDFNAIFGFLL